MPKYDKYRAKWKANMAKCTKYHAKCKVTMPKCSKYHAKRQVLVPNCCKYKANGAGEENQNKFQNLRQKKIQKLFYTQTKHNKTHSWTTWVMAAGTEVLEPLMTSSSASRSLGNPSIRRPATPRCHHGHGWEICDQKRGKVIRRS